MSASAWQRIVSVRAEMERNLLTFQPHPPHDREIKPMPPTVVPPPSHHPTTPVHLPYPEKRPLREDFPRRIYSPDDSGQPEPFWREPPEPMDAERREPVAVKPGSPKPAATRPTNIPSNKQIIGRKGGKLARVRPRQNRSENLNWKVDTTLPPHYRESRSQLFIREG